MELKTLNDLPNVVWTAPTKKGGGFAVSNKLFISNEGTPFVSTTDLREEAIKWLKLSDYDLYEMGFGESDNTKDLRKWIKDFFNITEEDLE